ncbi:MAG: YicC family protein [Paludibacteraceae bacterium]|nr:YicC family protein [Paludibacteraceae bacterium]
MIKSMTGYGKSVGEYEGRKIAVEVKSLNSKQLDLLTRIPAVYKEKEMALRNELAQVVERGKVEFTISVENVAGEMALKLNTTVVEAYYKQVSDLAQRLGVNPPSDWLDTLLRIPDVFKTETQELNDAEWAVVSKTIQSAIEAFNEFRVQEGESLACMFRQKLENIARYLEEVEVFEKERVEKIKTRLRENLESLSVDYNKDRFEQELIFYIEKLDVSEEKVRLCNHLKYFAETMAQDTSNGKKLGFIAQEMGREINTLGSKSNHAEMQILVVKMKDELEQIKEQVLNVL